ncbi:hypothetical protein CDIK_2423 [Cucumispora dikerogammari]|nr:hypothetical protein CDIK_2423 [Cucumispora dikerogammari]
MQTSSLVKEIQQKIDTILSNERIPPNVRNNALYKLREDLQEKIIQMKNALFRKNIEIKNKEVLITGFRMTSECSDEMTIKELIVQEEGILENLRYQKEALDLNKPNISTREKFDLKIKNYVIDQILGYDIQLKDGEVQVYSNYSSIDDYHILLTNEEEISGIQSSSETTKIDTRSLVRCLHLKQYGRFFVEYTLLKAEQSTVVDRGNVIEYSDD